MRAITIANLDDADTGFVGDRFRHHGYSFDECLRESPTDWPDLDGHDLVLLLGSEWSVYWPEVAQSVRAEVALVHAAARRGIPVFGICFGHQVLAHALGGSAFRADTPEIGWMHVETDMPSVIAPGPWMQWHYDVVSLPHRATEMARSAVGPQAWNLGRVFATQFHPEVNESVVRRWASGAGAEELLRIGSNVDALMEVTRDSIDASRSNAERLVDWFCDSVVPIEYSNVLDLP
ncbi:MAG: gamma-glutamyl-gamma-aminobutyrate hydrolase family protein [Actinomycetota bacterium]